MTGFVSADAAGLARSVVNAAGLRVDDVVDAAVSGRLQCVEQPRWVEFRQLLLRAMQEVREAESRGEKKLLAWNWPLVQSLGLPDDDVVEVTSFSA